MIRILICLILGAITTVAVAWACAAYARWSINDLSAYYTPVRMWNDTQWVWIQEIRVFGLRQRGIAAEYSTFGGEKVGDEIVGSIGVVKLNSIKALPDWSRLGIRSDNPNILANEEQGSGWPSLSMCCTLYEIGINPPREIAQPSSGLHIFNRQLPLRPIWPGFLIDTIIYAAILFGVFLGFTSAKRFIRAKRGRCPRCGYDLRGQLAQGCPECGWNRKEAKA